MKRHRSGIEGWPIFFLLAILILGIAWLYTNWQSSQTVLPSGLTINGQDMGGMTRDQALSAIALDYTLPITVHYQDQVTQLLPEMVDLALDLDATAENLDEILATQTGMQGFFNYVRAQALQPESETQAVKAVVTYSRERVDAFLERTAQKYDQVPQTPVWLSDVGVFRPPQQGMQLDMEASRPLLVAAILAAAPEEREVYLIVQTEPAPVASMGLLRDAIAGTLSGYDGTAGLFIKHIPTGQELCINCDIAFSGLSTLKLGVVLTYYYIQGQSLDPYIDTLISTTLTTRDPVAADALLAQIGLGDPSVGTMQVSQFLTDLGLQSTFIAAPFGYDASEGIASPNYVTPGNSVPDLNTNPNPYLQTTPLEMGILLEGIAQCAREGGFLHVLYPKRLTSAECQSMLSWMTRNEVAPPVGANLPPEITIAHQDGWGDNTYVDLALVGPPGGEIVLSIFLHTTEWLVWEESLPAFSAIGQLAYSFFNPE
ncbi:MAG: serine hydrolase [Anaerolineae bacterium]|nr:serine hydrolase [Anaerolineae bacterium]